MLQPMRSARDARGFVGLFIIVLLLAAVGTAIGFQYVKQQQRMLVKATGASSAFPEVDRAIAAFVATNRRLPCPALPTNANGTEGVATTVNNSDTCTAAGGVLPWGTLGLPLSSALDSWGRKLSYRVFAGATGLTRLEGMSATDCNTSNLLAASAVNLQADGSCAAAPRGTRFDDFLAGKGLTVNDRGTARTGMAYVIISHGPTGRGAYAADHASQQVLPNAASNEFLNTTATVNNTYWILAASPAGSDQENAAFFDDIVAFKSITDLQAESGLAPRDWGWVTLTKAFAPNTFSPNAVTPQTTTLTITLTNSGLSEANLQSALVDTFPADMVVAAAPAATTTCNGTGLTATPGSGSVSLPTTRRIPAATEAGGVRTPGSCTITVPVTINLGPTSTTTTRVFNNMLAAGTNVCATAPIANADYLCTNAGWNLTGTTATVTASLTGPALTGVSPNTFVGSTATRTMTLTGTSFISGATATFTNLSTMASTTVATTFVSSTQLTANFVFGTSAATWRVLVTNPDGQTTGTQTIVITASAPAPATFNQAALAAAGVTFTGNCAAQNPITAFDSLSIQAFASYSPVYVSADSNGIGVIDNTCTASSVSGSNGNAERLRFTAQGDVRYLGISLALFNRSSSALSTRERGELNFYDSANNLVSRTILTSCTPTGSTANTTFYVDAGATFSYVDITAIDREEGTDSTLRVAGAAFCSSGPASSCTTPATVGSVCPTVPASSSLTQSALTTAGVTFSGNCASQNPITAINGINVQAFASYSPVYISSDANGIGVVDAACGASSLSGTTANNELLRLSASSGARYLGLTLSTFNQNGSLPSAIETARLRFYNSSGTLLLTRNINSCLPAFGNGNATFYIDAGTTFAYVDLDARDRADGSDSTLRVAGAAMCNTGPASSCTTPATVGTVCP
jgi:hypothetical protein